MDNKKLGIMPHWYIALQGVNSVFGGDSANALTARNLASLNEAFADGFYDYFTLLYFITISLKHFMLQFSIWW